MFQPWEIEQIADRIFDQIKGGSQTSERLEQMLEKTTARIGYGSVELEVTRLFSFSFLLIQTSHELSYMIVNYTM